jgi:hypothetical protein
LPPFDLEVPPSDLEVPPSDLEVPPSDLEVPPSDLEVPPSDLDLEIWSPGGTLFGAFKKMCFLSEQNFTMWIRLFAELQPF